MLTYLNTYAKKAYMEIERITERPDFLFSNDPQLTQLEYIQNYRYIHGFTRLMKNDRIENLMVAKALMYVEEKLENYLKLFYNDKKFKLYIYADIGIPGFTLTLVSAEAHDSNKESKHEEMDLLTLVDWFKNSAPFNGIMIRDTDTEHELECSLEEEEEFSFKRVYIKIITT